MTEKQEGVFQARGAASLTFVDDSEDDLSITALHIWRVTHLAGERAIKGRFHLMQADGDIPSQNISRPHRMPFKTPSLGRVWYPLVEKYLTHTSTYSMFKRHQERH